MPPLGSVLCCSLAADPVNGGADRDRTDDPLLAKQVLSQLSYSPVQLPALSFQLSATALRAPSPSLPMADS